jgi:SulP family sulfate permease
VCVVFDFCDFDRFTRFMNLLKRLFPPLEWGPQYRRDDLQGDLVAGLTVGVMLIPQGMAYALIAGLPPIYGLYASLVPLIIYALFGTSRQLAVGPVAMVSLLVAAGVAPLAGGDMELYIALALTLSLMVGAIQFGLGVARFGFLVNFLSHPVLSGFTSAAALIIGLSQLKHLLGVEIARSNYIHEILWAALQQAGDVHLWTLAIGVASIALLIGVRQWNKALPGALFVVVLGTLVVWLGGLEAAGVAIVGDVPRGLPAPTMPDATWTTMQNLLPTALTIALVGFMESIAVAKVYASRNRYEVDANQELIGLGLANLVGALFRAYPTTGGFSRTAVNAQAGATTTVASLVSAGVIALTLLFLTPLFYALPKAVLAAIVMVAVFGLIEWKEALFLWRVDRKDFALMMLTFVATLGLGIEEGILVGVIASLVVVIHQSTRPHTAIMGRLPDSHTYRNIERNPEALTTTDVVVLRMDASLYFANVAFFKEQLDKVRASHPHLRAVVLDAYPVNRIDASAAHALKEVVEELHHDGIAFYVAGVKGPVMDRLKKAGLVDLIGSRHFCLEVHEAVSHAERAAERATPPTETEELTPA